MAKCRAKARLELIAECINVAALRIRVEYPTPEAAKQSALKELIDCREALINEIEDLQRKLGII